MQMEAQLPSNAASVCTLPDERMRRLALEGLAEFITECGGDVRFVSHRFEIDLTSPCDRHGFVSCSAFLNLLEHCARELGRPFFGFELSRRQSVTMFELLYSLAVSSADGWDILTKLVKFQARYHASATTMNLVQAEDALELVVSTRIPRVSRKRQSQEWSCGLLMKLMRQIFEGEWDPLYVRIAAPSPDIRHNPMNVQFGCDIYYEQSVTAIALPRSIVERARQRRFAASNDQVRDAERRIEALCSGAIEEMVDDSIARMAQRHRFDLHACAEELGMSARNIQLKLGERGLKFSELLRRRRMLLACDYLIDSTMSLSEISWQLGYSDQSTFTRTFSRWHGLSPGEYRTRHGQN